MELTNKYIHKAKDRKVIGYVREALTSKLFSLVKDRKVYRDNAIISNDKRKVPERAWLLGGEGIRTTCKPFLYGQCL